MNKKTCEFCQWSRSRKKELGVLTEIPTGYLLCKLYPPVFIKNNYGEGFVSPVTDKDNFCSHWKEKEKVGE